MYSHVCTPIKNVQENKVKRSLELRGEVIVHRAQILPVLWGNLRCRPADVVFGSFCKGNSETSFKMPINVAMQEPGSWVVGEEAECSISTIDGIHITTERIDEVGDNFIRGQGDIECMTVQMEWVGSGTRDCHLNERVPRNNEHLLRRKEVQRRLSTAQDLKKNGDGGGDVRNAVDIEERGVRLGNVEDDSNIGRTITELAWHLRSNWVHLGVKQLRATRVNRSRLNSPSTLVAQDSKSEVGVEVGVVGRVATSGRSTDPVVVDGLVGVENSRNTLGGVNINVLDSDRVVFDTIGFHEGDVVVINGEGKEWTAGCGENAEPVALATLNVNDSEWNQRASDEATLAVNEARVWYRDNTTGEELIGPSRGKNVVPIREGDDRALVVDIIQMLQWVIGIVNRKDTTEAVAVLRGQVGVVPEVSGLARSAEFINKCSVRGNRTLIDKGGTVHVRSPGLEETMPMDRSTAPHKRVGQLIVGGDAHTISFLNENLGRGISTVDQDSISFKPVGRNPSIVDCEFEVTNCRKSIWDQCR